MKNKIMKTKELSTITVGSDIYSLKYNSKTKQYIIYKNDEPIRYLTYLNATKKESDELSKDMFKKLLNKLKH